MNKVKKMLYSQKVAPYVFVLPFVISLLVFWLYPLISGIVMSFQDISFWRFSVGWSEALSENWLPISSSRRLYLTVWNTCF